jgi:hypothetical protein
MIRPARLLLLLGCLCATTFGVASTAGARLTVGVSDNGAWMFSSNSFQRLHLKTARMMVAWNAAVTRNHSLLNETRAWVRAAEADHVQPMISFQAPGGVAGNHVPSVSEYRNAIRAFIRDFPSVKVYTPWNEPDFIYRGLARNPGLAAQYFNVLIRWCHHCTIVAGDVYRPAWDGLASWVRAYKRGLHARPAAWALHPYDDVRTHTKAQILAFIRAIGRGSHIWLDEISGVERRGHWPWPNQSPNAADKDERFMFVLPKIFHQITRIYHYQWQAVPAAGWDSGLLGPQGKPRPAYWTFANAAKGKLPK